MPGILNNPSLWPAVEDLYEGAKALEDGWATLRKDTESLNCGMEQSTTQLSARNENTVNEKETCITSKQPFDYYLLLHNKPSQNVVV